LPDPCTGVNDKGALGLGAGGLTHDTTSLRPHKSRSCHREQHTRFAAFVRSDLAPDQIRSAFKVDPAMTQRSPIGLKNVELELEDRAALPAVGPP
jgi:hypothetical protein